MRMQRFAPYLSIVAALALGVFIAVFSGATTVQRAPVVSTSTASSTISIVPVNIPATVETEVGTTTPEPMQTAPKKAPSSPQAAERPARPVAAPVPVSPPPPSPSENAAALDAAAVTLRAALVNILCYVPVGSGLHSISGSGIIIDPKGIILTNAHVAQYFLLADRNASCTIRVGSPATDSYEASLIYISPTWLRTNADILTRTAPSGTGEYDFALLAVTTSATSRPLPSPFPFIPLATMPVAPGTPVVIATYGAQFLESSQVRSALFPTIVFGSVKDIFTFNTNTIDVLALGGSAAAQEGSSGGGVADASGTLVGTVTTSTVKGTTDTRSLGAITASYIRAAYATETGRALDLLLAEPTATSIADFAPQIPALEALITADLP